jgi:hypothetical protein
MARRRYFAPASPVGFEMQEWRAWNDECRNPNDE